MSGLNRYDGYHFKIFRHDQKDTSSLTDDFISKIVEGPGNKLWIATRNGMNVFDPLTEKFSRNTASALNEVGIVSNLITDIRKDTKGDFWFLSGRQTLYRYSQSAKRSTVVFKTLFQQNEIASFDIGNNGHCYIIHTNGVITVLDAATGSTISSNNIPAKVFGSSPLLYSVFTDNDNELWIYFSALNPKGVLRLNPANGHYTLLEKDKGMPKLNTNLVVSIQQDNQDNIWLSTDHGGVNIYNKKTNTIQYLLHNDDDSKSLSQNSITVSYKDNTGIIWLGTYKQGISYYHENIIKFPVYRHQLSNPASLPFDDVNRFVEDAKGNIWIGTNGGGLIYYDRIANKFIQYKHQPGNLNSISNNVIVSLFIDHQQKLWIGSYYGGLDCYDNGRFIHYKNDPSDPNSLSDNRVWEIYEDSKKKFVGRNIKWRTEPS
jgi:ligand-binding sensor domain-containing protein